MMRMVRNGLKNQKGLCPHGNQGKSVSISSNSAGLRRGVPGPNREGGLERSKKLKPETLVKLVWNVSRQLKCGKSFLKEIWHHRLRLGKLTTSQLFRTVYSNAWEVFFLKSLPQSKAQPGFVRHSSLPQTNEVSCAMGECNKMITAIVTRIASILNVHDSILFCRQVELHSEHIIADFVLALVVGTCQSQSQEFCLCQ